MSQITNPSTSSGNLPGNVPTQFTEQDAVAGQTTATPSGNNLNIFGRNVTTNDNNGISTFGTGSTVFVQLTNRSTVTAVTSDGLGQSQTVIIFIPAANKSFTFRVLVTGYDANNNVMTGGEIVGVGRSNGVAAVIIGQNDVFDECDANVNPLLDMSTADYNIITSGANLEVNFMGIATKTINWKATFEYIQSP